MNTTRLVADSLWQCLCPFLTQSALSGSRGLLTRRPRATVQCLAVVKPSKRRALSQASQEAVAAPESSRERANHHNLLASVPDEQARKKLPVFESFAQLDNPRRRKPKFEATTGLRKAGQGEKRELILEDESTPILYEIAQVQAGLGNGDEVLRIVRHLVEQRKERPSLRLYSALILCNVNPSQGAAWRVIALLEEMADEGISLDVGICHQVLKVLSVHVDYLLRADILEYMQQRWLSLTAEGHHDVTAALFREGQLEMGLEKLDQLKSEGYAIQPWLSDLATYILTDYSEYDDALALIQDQVAAGEMHISRSLWSHLLDHASAAFHHPATSYCWKSQVNTGYINPSAGTCLNVLSTASRAGDAALATEVFHVLGKRGTNFQAIHYEQLLSTYLSSNPPDIRAALTVLTIMTTVKLEPDTLSTRPLFIFFRDNPDTCQEAFNILVSLNEADRTVPIAALNVIIEAYVNRKDLEQALVIYKAMHTFEKLSLPGVRKPLANVETFNLLIRGIYLDSAGASLDTAAFLVSEMLALGVQPDSLTYDRLIHACLGAGAVDHAWRYFDEMESLEFKPRSGTVEKLAKVLARSEDVRCWDVLQRSIDQGIITDRPKLEIEKAWALKETKFELDSARRYTHSPEDNVD